MFILIIFRELRGSKSLNTRKVLNCIVFLQYVPRIFQIYQSWKDPNKRADKLSETPMWVKAAFNFSLYIIASHVSLILYWFYIHQNFTLTSIILKSMFCWFACTVLLDFKSAKKEKNQKHLLKNDKKIYIGYSESIINVYFLILYNCKSH